MSETRNILFCTDFSEHADTAFEHAVDQAKKYNAKLHVFHVIMPSDPCAYSPMKKSTLPDDAGRSSDSEEDLAQQAIGAMKLKYPELLKKRFLKEYTDKLVSPYIAAQMGIIDDIVLPHETRSKLINALESLKTKSVSTETKKHGNMPL